MSPVATWTDQGKGPLPRGELRPHYLSCGTRQQPGQLPLGTSKSPVLSETGQSVQGSLPATETQGLWRPFPPPEA